MDNQLSQFLASREKSHTQHYGAHSGSHSGLSDYNDGGSFSHYGGNDDNYTHEKDKNAETEDFDGKVAYGNDSESDDDNDHGKYHSGL